MIGSKPGIPSFLEEMDRLKAALGALTPVCRFHYKWQ
jgi:hypothetical protein